MLIKSINLFSQQQLDSFARLTYLAKQYVVPKDNPIRLIVQQENFAIIHLVVGESSVDIRKVQPLSPRLFAAPCICYIVRSNLVGSGRNGHPLPTERLVPAR